MYRYGKLVEVLVQVLERPMSVVWRELQQPLVVYRCSQYERLVVVGNLASLAIALVPSPVGLCRLWYQRSLVAFVVVLEPVAVVGRSVAPEESYDGRFYPSLEHLTILL